MTAGRVDHDLDMEVFTPLAPEQIFYLLAFQEESNQREIKAAGLRKGTTSAASRLDQLAFFIASNCPDLPPPKPKDVQAVLRRLDKMTWHHSSKYSMWAQLFPDRWWTFMNFGYDDLDAPERSPSLTGTERHWSSAVRLYDKVARTVALRGKDVLEVGSGRGGGAAYVARRFSPRSYTALDATRSNVLFSKSVHRCRNLRFLQGLAEALPFPAESVDAVINIQVCNYYDLHEFATEVQRVLRTPGYLITAFWDEPRNALKVRDTLGREGFRLVHQEDISSGVRSALTRFWNGDCEKLLRGNRTVLRKKVYMEMLRFFFSSPGLMDRTSSYVIFVHERR